MKRAHIASIMDYKAIIDFNKYTLALAAAGFVYALNNYEHPATTTTYWAVLVMLFLFIFSTLVGILVSSTATSRLHKEVSQRPKPDYLIQYFGITHITSLVVAMLILGGLVFSQFIDQNRNPLPKKEPTCCCTHRQQ